MRHLALAHWSSRLGAALLVVAVGSVGLVDAQVGAVSPPFDAPSSMAIIGSNLFVANQANSTVSEVNAQTGALVTTLPTSTIKVSGPRSIVADNNDLFVAGTSGTVSMISGSGTFLGRLSVPNCTGGAAGLAVENASVVVELCGNGNLAEISTAPLSVAALISPSTLGVTKSTAIAIRGTTAYVTSVTPTNKADGLIAVSLATKSVLLRVTEKSNPGDGFAAPAGVAVLGKYVWVTNAGTGTTPPSVAVFTRSNLSFVKSDHSSSDLGTAGAVLASHTPSTNNVYVATLDTTTAPMVTYYNTDGTPLNFVYMWCNSNDSRYQFANPSAFAVYGSMLWVANAGDSQVEAMDAVTGGFITYAG